MQKSGRWLFSFSHRKPKQDSSINDGRQQGSDSSQSSAKKSTSESRNTNPPIQSPLRSLTQQLLCLLIKCFNPRPKKTDQKYRSIRTDDTSSTSVYNKQASSEFRSEIRTLSKVEHLNLVRLLGYLEHGDEQILVVEYVGNGSLREHLDGTCGDVLELAERLDIAIDVAHAITYHRNVDGVHVTTTSISFSIVDQPIIHRDIKASNILLTENLRAKVADFGFARLAPEDSDATHISTQIKGTAGYLDPEYLRTYQLTEKSDVYSFGVLLVELVTGLHPIERGRDANRDRITTRWAMHKFQQEEVVVAMDPRLRRSPAAIAAVEKLMALAYGCLSSPRSSRPAMKRCAEVLWEIRRDFREAQIAAQPPPPPLLFS